MLCKMDVVFQYQIARNAYDYKSYIKYNISIFFSMCKRNKMQILSIAILSEKHLAYWESVALPHSCPSVIPPTASRGPLLASPFPCSVSSVQSCALPWISSCYSAASLWVCPPWFRASSESCHSSLLSRSPPTVAPVAQLCLSSHGRVARFAASVAPAARPCTICTAASAALPGARELNRVLLDVACRRDVTIESFVRKQRDERWGPSKVPLCYNKYNIF